MNEKPVERKLVALIAADMVGYSRLMEEDEEGTHNRLQSLREELINPEIAAHNGRVATLAGDGVLVEFASTAQAVNCAAKIQLGMAERNKRRPLSEQAIFKIGIHLGDVIVDGEDIYGAAVNLAVRIQDLAKPGSILISGIAYDQVKGRIQHGFEFLGEREIKHLDYPVRVYQVALDSSDEGTVLGEQVPSDHPITPRSAQSPRIFLAHAREDKPLVRKLYADLKKNGFSPWIDEVDLFPGQVWTEVIPRAIADADIFLACLSARSCGKVGYVQSEFRRALTALSNRPPDSIFLIPVRLDECEVPDLRIPELELSLRHIQWVDLFEENGLDRLVRAIEHAIREGG